MLPLLSIPSPKNGCFYLFLPLSVIFYNTFVSLVISLCVVAKYQGWACQTCRSLIVNSQGFLLRVWIMLWHLCLADRKPIDFRMLCLKCILWAERRFKRSHTYVPVKAEPPVVGRGLVSWGVPSKLHMLGSNLWAEQTMGGKDFTSKGNKTLLSCEMKHEQPDERQS